MTQGRIARGVALVFAVCGTAFGIGCAAPPDEDGTTGTAQVAITNVPLDGSVFCIRVTATANISVQKMLDVSPGQSTVFQLSGLPVGSVAFTGDAFPIPCPAVTPMAEPTWLSDPVIAQVSPSPPVSVLLAMHRNGHAQVGVDFPPDPSCSTNGGPCQSDAQCCSGSCDVIMGICTAGNQSCMSPADCPTPPTECVQSVCTGGLCGLTVAPAGSVVPTQVAGDCKTFVCDGMGNLVSVVDDADISDDGNQCTNDACQNGAAAHFASPLGSPCNQNGGQVCGNAVCVECNGDADCPGWASCVNNACQAVTCVDAVHNGSETDVDCGGAVCPACTPGHACIIGADCTSHVCLGGICQAPSCADGVKNGNETDIDCGFVCAPCASGKACVASPDCQSGVCANGICQ